MGDATYLSLMNYVALTNINKTRVIDLTM